MLNHSFEEVLKDYLPLIKNQMKQLNIYTNFEEFYQVGQIALWKAYCHYNPEKGHFAFYAKQRVRGDLIDFLRKEAKYKEHHLISDAAKLHHYSIVTEHEESPYERFVPYLHLLSDREKTWFIETIIHQLKLSEIAQKYSVSTHTVASWRKSVIKKLSYMMKPEEN
ncbi:putative RNA polymerase [Bacillus sp. TS-2]|nr:putative RNA polymerase [Bacillus sp. TS-2]